MTMIARTVQTGRRFDLRLESFECGQRFFSLRVQSLGNALGVPPMAVVLHVLSALFPTSARLYWRPEPRYAVQGRFLLMDALTNNCRSGAARAVYGG